MHLLWNCLNGYYSYNPSFLIIYYFWSIGSTLRKLLHSQHQRLHYRTCQEDIYLLRLLLGPWSLHSRKCLSFRVILFTGKPCSFGTNKPSRALKRISYIRFDSSSLTYQACRAFYAGLYFSTPTFRLTLEEDGTSWFNTTIPFRTVFALCLCIQIIICSGAIL